MSRALFTTCVLMAGAVRPILGGALLLGGGVLLWRRGRRGWQPADTP